LLSKRPVAELIWERLPATLELAFLSVLIALSIALPLGVAAAVRKDSIFDRCAIFISLLGVSLPTFWLGPILVLVFSIGLGIFPVSERTSWDSYVLPSLTLGLALSAVLMRMTRASLLDVLGQDYVQTARAKGLSEFRVQWKHALRNALIPVITILSLQLGALLSGTVITETIFDWPGLGELLYRAIQARDYPLVQGCVLVIASLYVIVNLAADVAYSLVNPQVRLE
jgi:peptide/nickel transport system permease protein